MVTTALEGRTIYQINRERAHNMAPAKAPIATRRELEKLQSRLKKEIPAATGMDTASPAIPQVSIRCEGRLLLRND